ncbi:MAG: alginate lyase family protein [Saprospiraceae bacterium]|nr:alginate lyase family protein [Saprospiraceae bacterium]
MNKFARYFYTISSLTSEQIFFQLVFRLKKIFHYKWNRNTTNENLLLIVPRYLPTKKTVISTVPPCIKLLNIVQTFNQSIDWNIKSNGALWNYHLQYVEFLLDPDLKISIKEDWLLDISNKILSNELRPEAFPCSIRIIHTLLFHHQIERDIPEIKNAILLQLNWLQTNLEKHIQANHLLINKIALSFGEIFFGSEINIKSHEELIKEIKKQITSDGMHYERSPMYHMEVMKLLLSLYGVCQEQNSSLKLNLHSTLQKMASWLFTFKNDFNYVPPFQDSTLSSIGLASDLLNICDRLMIPYNIVQLDQCGYRILKTDVHTVWINGGSIQPDYQPGHAHSDMVHFAWAFQNQPIIVDTGISTYESSQKRLFEKSTSAHNTVNLGNINQSDIWSSFRVGKRARIQILKDQAKHFGAEVTFASPDSFKHTRHFILTEHVLTIEDKTNTLEISTAHFHFDHTIKDQIEIINQNSIKIKNFLIQWNGAVKITKHTYDQALDFNTTTPSVKIEIEFKEHLITQIHLNA